MRTMAQFAIMSLAALNALPATVYSQETQARPQVPRSVQNVLVNGGFDNDLGGWNPFWTRVHDTGIATLDRTIRHDGMASVRIEHRGEDDWSLEAAHTVTVKTGEVYEYSGWMRVEGKGRAEISVVLRDASGEVISWSYGGRTANATEDCVC